METRVRYLAGAFVALHGLVYLATPLTGLSERVFQGWTGTSILLGSALGSDVLRSLSAWFWILAGVGLMAAGGAIVFTSFVPGVWRPLAIGAAVVGVASFLIFWDGQIALFVNQGGIGLVISVVIAAAAFSFPKAVP